MVTSNCPGCNSKVNGGQYLFCLNEYWHPECFCCQDCKLPIIDHKFSTYEGLPYHESCHRKIYPRKCDVCKHSIPKNSDGVVKCMKSPFWGQIFCPSHLEDGTPICCSCDRLEPRRNPYFVLDDGRKLCLECKDSAIMDTESCQSLYKSLQTFYEGLNMKIDKEIPVYLVERDALNDARDMKENTHHNLRESRGTCLLEARNIKKKKRLLGFAIGNKAQKNTKHYEVTAILIMCGLPRLLTGSLLAHEMMHACLRHEDCSSMNEFVEEGICQVMSHMWLEAELSFSATLNDFEKKLGEYIKNEIESHNSPNHRDGFKAGQEAVRKYGLEKTLRHIKEKGYFHRK